jgi:hypothetical protein
MLSHARNMVESLTRELSSWTAHLDRVEMNVARIEGTEWPPRETVDSPRTYALDFDGTLYAGEFAAATDFSGEPCAGAVDFVRQLLDAGHKILIHSCRLTAALTEECTKRWGKADPVIVANLMRDWFYRWGLPWGHIRHINFWTSPGKPWANVYLDDKAMRFEGTFPNIPKWNGHTLHAQAASLLSSGAVDSVGRSGGRRTAVADHIKAHGGDPAAATLAQIVDALNATDPSATYKQNVEGTGIEWSPLSHFGVGGTIHRPTPEHAVSTCEHCRAAGPEVCAAERAALGEV